MLKTLLSSLLAVGLFTGAAFAQSQNASLAGQVTDQSGAFVPKATVTVTSTERQLSSTVETDDGGRFSFPNLNPGTYDLSVAANGFKSYVQRGLQLLANQSARIDASLQLGDAATKIEVTADVAQLNVDNGGKQEGVAPTIINQLPLLVSAGTPRNAVQFISFLPGVNTGSSPQAFIVKLRVQAACEALQHEGSQISEVAGSLGFCDQSAFTQLFQKHVGITPLKYQKRYRLRREQ